MRSSVLLALAFGDSDQLIDPITISGTNNVCISEGRLSTEDFY